MNKKILLLAFMTMIIVSACEKEIPEVEDSIKLKKILVKDWGYIEFNYDGKQVSEMICAFTNWETPEYALHEFRYENDELCEVIKTIYPDSINSIPRATLSYTFDFSEDKVDLTADYEAETPTINEETSWDLDAKGNLIHQDWHNGRANWAYSDLEWENSNLIQSQMFRVELPDSLYRLDTYQYDDKKSYSDLFTKEFLLAMCWIDYDFYFDKFKDAILSVNNCKYKKSETFSYNLTVGQTHYSYTYHESGFPESVRIDSEWLENGILKSSSSSFYELEYE